MCYPINSSVWNLAWVKVFAESGTKLLAQNYKASQGESQEQKQNADSSFIP